MNHLPCLLFSALMLARPALAASAGEQENLTLLLSQLSQMNATLQRAEAQASMSPEARFFFDYPQACADLRTMREGVERYLAPSRAQPQTVLPLAGDYRREASQ